MQFTDLVFLSGFFPLTLFLYQMLIYFHRSMRWCNVFLVAASLIFYAFGSLRSLLVLLFVLAWNWISAQALDFYENSEDPGMQAHKKNSLILCIAVNLLILFVYKYLNVWTGWIPGLRLARFIMPAGLSFYMFSCLSYVLDVYNNRASPCSLLNFALFAAFFGRVNMGPVGHYASFEEQLDNHPVTMRLRKEGAALFLQGIMYKVLLADNFALVFSGLGANASWLGNLLLGFSYFFELYFDFAGYSRMARGLGAIFGFQIPKNFDQPYQARSVQEFWRRWHISLTDWFRDYIYIPLGGNRVDHRRWMLNVLCVWLLTGIWHGAAATFLIWGLYQGGLILFEHGVLKKHLESWPGIFGHVWVIITQLIGWTLFSAPDFTSAWSRLGRYFGLGIQGFFDDQALFYLYGSLALFLAGILVCSGVPSLIAAQIRARRQLNRAVLGALGYGLGFLLCLAFLISQTSQTFLYAVF